MPTTTRAAGRLAHCKVVLDGDLEDRLDREQADLETEADLLAADDPRRAEITARLEQLAVEWDAARITVTFRATGRGRRRYLQAEFPADDDGNEDQYHLALMAECLVEPQSVTVGDDEIKLDLDGWRYLYEHVLDDASFVELYSTCWSANMGGGGGPASPELLAALSLLSTVSERPKSEQPSDSGSVAAS